MALSRRNALGLAASAGAYMLTNQVPFAQASSSALKGDEFFIKQNQIIVRPINHASLILSVNDKIVYVDPVGDVSRYAGLPPADIILITHHHSDHFEKNLLTRLATDSTKFVVNSVVNSRMPSATKSNTTSLKNGAVTDALGINFAAIPAYNTTQDRKQYHPKGRDNGYILGVEGVKIYIAGDTEDIPEMRRLTDIDIAFIPMNLPYTMDIDQAASAVNEFAPKTVYPYHYGSSKVADFKTKIDASNQNIDVRLANWY